MHDPKAKSMPTQTNQSSEKLLKLIEVLAQQGDPVRLQDLAAMCSMNSSTALRFLTALQRRDYVAQDIDSGKYFLTMKIRGLAENVGAQLNIRKIALPFLRSVAQVFSESCNLAVESDLSVMYVEVANAPNKTLMSTQRIGNIAPLHCTGVGKLLMTDFSSTKKEQAYALKGLPKFTENTLVTPQSLEEELAEIRRLGYAFDNEECEVGARCIAAPVRDYTGKVVAGVSVSGPTARMTDQHIFGNLPFLLDATRQISILMGWRDPQE